MIEVETKTTEELILEERKDQRLRLEKRANKIHESKKYHIQFVKCRCRATSEGYYGGRVIREGQVFTYDDAVKNGKLPMWCEAVDELDLEWDKLSEAEKNVFLMSLEPKKEGSSDESFEKELRLMRADLAKEKALRIEAEERLAKKDEVVVDESSEPKNISNSPFPEHNNSDLI